MLIPNADPGSTHPGMGLSPLPIPVGQAVAGSIIITVSSALVPLRSSYAFMVPADCWQVAAYLLFSRSKFVVTDNEIPRQIDSRNFAARL